jgi:hypothetical protein
VEPDDAFESMRTGARDFVISTDESNLSGRTLFPLTVLDREGWAQIGVSIWSTEDGPNGEETLPVDELALHFCIANTEESRTRLCKSSSASTGISKGPDSIRPLVPNITGPDAAIHFVDIGGAPVYGIFRRNDDPNSSFRVWAIDSKFKDLVANLNAIRDQIADSIKLENREEREQALRDKGRAMYNVLFPCHSKDGKAARDEFEAFARSALTNAPVKTSQVAGVEQPRKPKSIFVRMVGGDPPANLLPMNFMTIPFSSTQSDPLGLHFTIEQPLVIQNYNTTNKCISHWVVELPDDSTATNLGLTDLRNGSSGSEIDKWPHNWTSAKMEDDARMDKLRHFVTQTDVKDATALVIMSHQANQAVWFDVGRSLSSNEIELSFDEPSIIVLAGCDTAEPESWGFIGTFNRQGAYAAIATSTQIQLTLAQDFASCLVNMLGTNESTLGDVYFHTLQCLNDQWGSAALTFLLLGNPSLKLCSPGAVPQ